MRLLYVALTRAKEKLILVGSSKALEKKIEKWSGAGIDDGGNIKSSYVRNQKNYMDWIGAALINHKDGEFLRHYNENILKEDLKEDNSRFKVAIYPRESFEEAEDIILEDVPIKEKIDKLLVSNDENLCKDHYEAIKERLEFTYKYEEATKLPTVITVTELKEFEKNKLLGDNEKNDLFIDNNNLNEEAYKDLNYGEEVEEQESLDHLMQTPLFLQEKKGLTPSEVGTAYHNIMQRLDLSGDLTKEDITSQINTMVDKELITFEAAKSVKVDKILKFLQSNIGKKVIESYKGNTLKRELPFRVEISASTIYPNINEEKYSEEKMPLRGVIDCYFEDGEKGIILDYKTDYVKEDSIEEIKARYKVQLDYYSNAVKDAFKKEKVKKYLYLFSLDREVEVE